MSFKMMVLAAVLGSICSANPIPAGTQCQGQSCVGKELYQHIIDIKFPVPPDPSGDTFFVAVLRFLPALGQESQINISRNGDGQYKIVEYFIPSGSKSIWAQLQESWAADSHLDSLGPAEIAKRFRVETRTVSITDRTMIDLLTQLDNLEFPSITREPRKGVIVLDASQYEFWYKGLLDDEIHFRYYSTGLIKGHAEALVEWMRRVRKLVTAEKQ
jgi:hypothetical protein